MSDELGKALAGFRSAIEQRVREQIARHAAIDPMFDPRRGVDMQIQQEREKLEKRLEEAQGAANIEALQSLINWLPELSRQIKGRK